MRVCFIGGARYSRPLDATSEKKWRALSALGELFVIGFSQDLKPRRFTEHAHFYLLPKFPVPVLRYLAMFVVGAFLALWLIVRYGVRILVAQSPYEGFAAAWAKIIARWLGRHVVLVVESHGDFQISLFLQRRVRLSGLYRFSMRRAAAFALRHADLLRAVSSSTERELRSWTPSKPLTRFITWTDLEVFWEVGEATGRSYREATAATILYAGVLVPLKGVHHLVRAFARIADEFPEASLVLVGQPGNKDYARSLAQEIARLGLDGRVRFVGKLPQRDLARWMAGARVLVLPSLSEGLGRVVIEAMAAGTPVIGSRVGGIPEVVEEGVTGFLVPPGDEAALADRLRWVLANPEAARAVGKRARDFARSFFSTDAYVDGYRRLFAMAEDFLQGTPTEHATPAL